MYAKASDSQVDGRRHAYAANKICPQSDNIELMTLEIRQTAIPESAF